MSIDSIIDFTCENQEVVKAFVKEVRKLSYSIEPKWKSGDNTVCVHSDLCYPYYLIAIVSKRFPDDIIKCYLYDDWDYSYGRIDDFDYREGRKYEVRNGEFKFIDLEPRYFIDGVPANNKQDEDGIYDKAVTLCRKLDMTVGNKEDGYGIRWFDEDVEVVIKFNYDGVAGKKYRVEVTKLGVGLEFEVSESDDEEIAYLSPLQKIVRIPDNYSILPNR